MEKISRKLNYKKLMIIPLILVLVIGIKVFIKPDIKVLPIQKSEKFIAGSSNVVKLYDEEYKEVEKIKRGTKVSVSGKDIKRENSDKIYLKIKYDKKNYLIEKESLVDTINDIVLEKKMYVRTPVTVYNNDKDSTISSMIKKGEELSIVGFNNIDADGFVDKYKIKHYDIEGYVYGKYLVNTKELSLEHYDSENTFLIHDKRGNTQGGGRGGNLDFYPRTKPKFENNIMPEEVRSLYLNTGVIKNIDEYIKLAKESNINAFVVDIKDNTSPGYKSPVMEKYSKTNYDRANNSFENYQAGIKKLIDAGFYVIGRITVFKDSYFIKDHPTSAIADSKTGNPFNHNNSFWPSAYNRLVWEFNVELAKEAVVEMGFHEIQFDYVRFPDRTKTLEEDGLIDMKNIYKEDKAEVIQKFLMYAADELHKVNAYISADVFGEAAHSYVTGYGQYWGAISNVVDVISAMPYPDHFGAHDYDFQEVVWTVPYKLLKFWGENYVVKRQEEIPNPAIVRTWIQTYDTYKKPTVEYNEDKVYEQIKALRDAGLTGGYMTWHSGSNMEKYRKIAPAFSRKD